MCNLDYLIISNAVIKVFIFNCDRKGGKLVYP
jgi:hypothetical protein